MKRVGEVFDMGDSSLAGQLGHEESVCLRKTRVMELTH